jgi:hypothetical protein
VEKSHLILRLLLLEEKEGNIQIINYIGPSPAGEGFRVRWKKREGFRVRWKKREGFRVRWKKVE